MQQKYRLHWREIWKRALSGALSAAILLSGMIIPSVAADDGGASIGGGGDPDMLSYTVAEGLDFNDTGVVFQLRGGMGIRRPDCSSCGIDRGGHAQDFRKA